MYVRDANLDKFKKGSIQNYKYLASRETDFSRWIWMVSLSLPRDKPPMDSAGTGTGSRFFVQYSTGSSVWDVHSFLF